MALWVLLCSCTGSDPKTGPDSEDTQGSGQETALDTAETGTPVDSTPPDTGETPDTGQSIETRDRLFPRSTIAFAQPDAAYPFTGSYALYGADMAAWIFLPASVQETTDTTDYRNLLTIHEQGDQLTSARVEIDVTWWGMTTRYPDSYTDAAVLDFDGEPLTLPWNDEHLWFCSHQPDFDAYVRWQISDQALAEGARPDLFMLDTQTTTPMTYYYGGCFCEMCMEDFRVWMSESHDGDELEALEIADIDSWDYHQHLVDQGYDKSSYEAAAVSWPNDVPLAEDYRRFQLEWLEAYVGDLAVHIRAEGGQDYEPGIGTSSPIWESGWPGTRTLFDAPDLTHYVLELGHGAQSGQVPTDPVLVYRMGDVFERPVLVTALPQADWAWMLSEDKGSLMRSWIALAYANGAHFLVPTAQWAGGDDSYEASSEDIKDLYQFIEEHPFLYDRMQTVSHTGVVYVNTAVRDNSQNVHDAVDDLQARNIPFHLVPAGDEWWDVRLDEEQLEGL
ncbi:MAG: hypothetical protein QGG40_10995, partial [Myxococcota bacterium]|nr:hypothetical protein [Myxococcota bacterium]